MIHTTYIILNFLPNFTIHKKKEKEFQKSSVIPYPILRHTLRWFRQYCPLWKLGFILIYLGWYSWIWFDIAHDISFKRGINSILTLHIVYEAVVAEWLRRLTRNQIPSGSAGSSPADCVIYFLNDFSYE